MRLAVTVKFNVKYDIRYGLGLVNRLVEVRVAVFNKVVDFWVAVVNGEEESGWQLGEKIGMGWQLESARAKLTE